MIVTAPRGRVLPKGSSRVAQLAAVALLATATTVLPAAPSLAAEPAPLDIEFTFADAMPQEAREAMLVVEDILNDYLASPVPVRMQISWEIGGDPDTLASAGPRTAEVNFTNAPKRNTSYVIALANAIAGEDLGPGQPHVTSTINGDLDWDYRRGATGPESFDFIGTMMHEVLHGLGFLGNGFCNPDDPDFCTLTDPEFESATPIYSVFDTFLVMGNGTPLTSFADGSAELKAALTSDDVFWNGPEGVKAARAPESEPSKCGNAGDQACPTKPKIHVPAEFETGSSAAHWDESTYPWGSPNAMMTAAGEPGETAQGYGPMTAAIMWEMGWPKVSGASPPAPEAAPPGRAFDGDPATTERAGQATPTAAAIAMSRASFADDGAQVATISRDDKFPDALSASALGAFGPLLFTNKDTLDGAVRAEVDRVLAPGATVYVVGGVGAVSQAIEDELVGAGYTVVRLRGANRFETSVAITREVLRLNPNADTLLFARGFGKAEDPNGSAAWADSISAAAYAAATRNPLLLVQTEAIPAAVRDYLTGPNGSADGVFNLRWVVLGGTAAVSQAVFDELGADLRVRGSGREATSIAIANQLFQVSPSGSRSYAIVHGRDVKGWAWGLAVSGAAGRAGAPILLVQDVVAGEVLAEVTGCGAHQVDLLVAGPTSVVSSQVQGELDARDNVAC